MARKAGSPAAAVAQREPAAPAGKPARDYTIDALAKGMRFLSLFSEQRPVLRLSDVVAETGMLMPTVYRIAMTLEAEGYLDRLEDGRYRPGAKVLSLGFAALRSMDMVELATRHLQELADRTGETVNLAVLSADKVIYLVRLRNRDLVTANIQVGSVLPAVHSSLGKVLLAYLPAAELRARITPQSFPATAGPRAARSLDELETDFALIRKQGFGLQDEELAHGLRSVAAPIRDSSGNVVAAANIAVNAMEWPKNRIVDELMPLVVETSKRISEYLGYR